MHAWAVLRRRSAPRAAPLFRAHAIVPPLAVSLECTKTIILIILVILILIRRNDHGKGNMGKGMI